MVIYSAEPIHNSSTVHDRSEAMQITNMQTLHTTALWTRPIPPCGTRIGAVLQLRRAPSTLDREQGAGVRYETRA